jgi:ribosomal protein S18 acetylase RimI-like enzyme
MTPPLPDGFCIRPYSPADLDRAVRFVGETYANSDCMIAHPGDFLHCMSNSWRGAALPEHFPLCEDAAGNIVALIMCYPARYGLFEVIVHPAHRGGALEAALVAEGEARTIAVMRAADTESTEVLCGVAECDTPRIAVLEAAGFIGSATPEMINNTRPLSDPIPDSVLPEGFSIRASEGEGEAEALGIVHSGAFGSNWTAEAYTAVIRTPGFHPERELVVVAPDGRLAAFLIYWVDTISGAGLFEPVGCHKDFQGKGLTKALMFEGMRRMKAHGLHTAVVNNLAENPAAAGLYRSVGFTPQHSIYDYKKPIV